MAQSISFVFSAVRKNPLDTTKPLEPNLAQPRLLPFS